MLNAAYARRFCICFLIGRGFSVAIARAGGIACHHQSYMHMHGRARVREAFDLWPMIRLRRTNDSLRQSDHSFVCGVLNALKSNAGAGWLLGTHMRTHTRCACTHRVHYRMQIVPNKTRSNCALLCDMTGTLIQRRQIAATSVACSRMQSSAPGPGPRKRFVMFVGVRSAERVRVLNGFGLIKSVLGGWWWQLSIGLL